MEKHFDHKTAQARWNAAWHDANVFAPDDSADPEKRFVITLPPPNVTGVLHVGHVLGDTVMDHLIRWKKMCGFNALWVPGTDHAGIATQKVVEDKLRKDGRTREELGREKFLEEAWKWKEHHHARIVDQMKNLGLALDWKREAFTLDDERSAAVREVFVRLYEKGLIYKGEYIVNWSPASGTAVSDEEVEYVEKNSHLWHIRYDLVGGGELIVATTRPETMLGDTGVAVSPDDSEKAPLVGKKAILPLVGREIPIVADDVVDKEFGSGFVKVTPAHDPNDFGIGQRHSLPTIVVIGRDGRMTDQVPEPFRGLDRFACRKAVVAALEESGHLVKTEPHTHSVGHHDRTGDVIEPLLSSQWFVKMEPLAAPAVAAAENEDVTFFPIRWRNVYMSWMTNIRDWCISRQLWWGHRIPAWYCADGHITVSREDPDACATCGASALTQDEDVLDTWFSSWLWTFTPLGWPNQDAPDLKRYHPTSVLVTGSEIIFFWVARMIMASLEFMKEVPFNHVFLTGIVRDGKGRKMSKSLGNSPDPLDIIDRWGSDAFRFTLSMLSPPGKDVFFDEDKLEIGRNFGNKMWQASRMVLSSHERFGVGVFGDNDAGFSESALGRAWHDAHGSHLQFDPELTWEDKWMLSALDRAATDVGDAFESWRLNDGTSRVYEFFWHEFCDWYLELAKNRLYGDGDKRTVMAVLLYVLGEGIKFVHPLMPYITEEIWSHLPMANGLLLNNRYPAANADFRDASSLENMEQFQQVVTAIRNIRAEYRVNPGERIAVGVHAEGDAAIRLERMRDGIETLAKVGELTIGAGVAKEKGSAAQPLGKLEVIVPLAGIVDLDAEAQRLAKEKEKIESELASVEKKLANENFVSRAKPEVVEREREKKTRLEIERDKINESLAIIAG